MDPGRGGLGRAGAPQLVAKPRPTTLSVVDTESGLGRVSLGALSRARRCLRADFPANVSIVTQHGRETVWSPFRTLPYSRERVWQMLSLDAGTRTATATGPRETSRRKRLSKKRKRKEKEVGREYVRGARGDTQGDTPPLGLSLSLSLSFETERRAQVARTVRARRRHRARQRLNSRVSTGGLLLVCWRVGVRRVSGALSRVRWSVCCWGARVLLGGLDRDTSTLQRWKLSLSRSYTRIGHLKRHRRCESDNETHIASLWVGRRFTRTTCATRPRSARKRLQRRRS